MSDESVIPTLESYIENLGNLGEHYKNLFNKSFNEAMKDVNDQYADTMKLYNPREMANVMHAHLRDRIKKNFRGLPGVDFDERPNRAFRIILDGRPIGINAVGFVKIKKSTKFFRTSNILTRAVREFMTQQNKHLNFTPEIQASLFPDEDTGLKPTRIVNLPSFVNLIACYVPNKIWSAFERLAVTFPVSINQIKLVSDFTEIAAHATADIIPMQPRYVSQQTNRVRSRQTGKKQTRKQLRKYIERYEPAVENQENIKKKKKEQ